MREIKFRAKDYQTNKWVYGFLFMGKGDDNRDYAFILQDKGLKVGTAAEDNAIEFPYDEAHLVDKETICQYTGLKDKNGKEIYEGDIIGCHNPNIKHLIFFNEKQGRFMAALDGDIENDYYGVCGLDDSRWNATKEVIGNIHDNPELINKEYLV